MVLRLREASTDETMKGDKDMSKGHKEVAERTKGAGIKQEARSC